MLWILNEQLIFNKYPINWFIGYFYFDFRFFLLDLFLFCAISYCFFLNYFTLTIKTLVFFVIDSLTPLISMAHIITLGPYLTASLKVLTFHVFETIFRLNPFLMACKMKSMFRLRLLYVKNEFFGGYNSLDWIFNRFHSFPFDFLKVHECKVRTKWE